MILYIEQTKADETIWFKTPIKGAKISLVSCSFYNLPSDGTISNVGGDVLIHLPRGNYNIYSFKLAVGRTVSNSANPISIEILENSASITTILDVVLNQSLRKLLNATATFKARSTNQINIIPIQDACIHCDLIDSTQVLVNNNYSQILACVDLSKAGEKIPYNPLHVPIKNDYINSIRFWVTDYTNKSINSGIYPMRMVIEIV